MEHVCVCDPQKADQAHTVRPWRCARRCLNFTYFEKRSNLVRPGPCARGERTLEGLTSPSRMQEKFDDGTLPGRHRPGAPRARTGAHRRQDVACPQGKANSRTAPAPLVLFTRGPWLPHPTVPSNLFPSPWARGWLYSTLVSSRVVYDAIYASMLLQIHNVNRRAHLRACHRHIHDRRAQHLGSRTGTPPPQE